MTHKMQDYCRFQQESAQSHPSPHFSPTVTRPLSLQLPGYHAASLITIIDSCD